MKAPPRVLRRARIVRPWWRRPMRWLLRITPRRRTLHGTLAHKILGPGIFDHRLWRPQRQTVAKGLAVGVFFGMLPVFGLQILLSVLIAYFWRVNLSAAILATFISNPITAGPLVYLQLELGKWMIPNIPPADLGEVAGGVRYVLYHGKPFVIGSFTTAVVGSVLAYPASLLLWDSLAKMRKGATPRPKDTRSGDPFSAAAPGLPLPLSETAAGAPASADSGAPTAGKAEPNAPGNSSGASPSGPVPGDLPLT